jgi:hypothetical protein
MNLLNKYSNQNKIYLSGFIKFIKNNFSFLKYLRVLKFISYP